MMTGLRVVLWFFSFWGLCFLAGLAIMLWILTAQRKPRG